MKQDAEILKQAIGQNYLYQRVSHNFTKERFTVFYVFCELVAGTPDKEVYALLERMDKSNPEQRAVVKVRASELEASYTLMVQA